MVDCVSSKVKLGSSRGRFCVSDGNGSGCSDAELAAVLPTPDAAVWCCWYSICPAQYAASPAHCSWCSTTASTAVSTLSRTLASASPFTKRSLAWGRGE